jgi:hypothetical protein
MCHVTCSDESIMDRVRSLLSGRNGHGNGNGNGNGNGKQIRHVPRFALPLANLVPQGQVCEAACVCVLRPPTTSTCNLSCYTYLQSTVLTSYHIASLTGLLCHPHAHPPLPSSCSRAPGHQLLQAGLPRWCGPPAALLPACPAAPGGCW